MSDFTFAHSYDGASQPVQVFARRDLDNDGEQDPVTLNYSINGGASARRATTNEWNGGDRYGGHNGATPTTAIVRGDRPRMPWRSAT